MTHIAAGLDSLRTVSPLVHNVTNYVVMNTTANALLAVGASPVMANAVEEVEEVTAASSALVLNIGTLSGEWVEAMLLAGKTAERKGLPIVLDPVGFGFTRYRTETVRRMLREFTPAVIKGNASEIKALADVVCRSGNGKFPGRGVDSTVPAGEVKEDAAALAAMLHCTVVASGPTDVITDGKDIAFVHNGDPLMARTTGMGCTASALTGAFAAVCETPFEAAFSAMAVMGVAGELAAEYSKGNGSFQTAFLDELCRMTSEKLITNLKWGDSVKIL